MASEATDAGLEVRCLSPGEAIRRVPVLEGAVMDGAILTPSDGVVDLAPLLEGYLSGARAGGITIRLRCRVTGIRRLSGGEGVVETPDGEIRTPVIVNASGAWAGDVGRMAGARIDPFRPARRHLFFTGPLPWVDEAWPFVWDLSAGLYFRPETGGLLVSPCDEGEHEPGIPPTDPEAEHLLARKVSESLPRMPDFPIVRGWAGLRTLTTDGHFVIGWDGDVPGLFWVAGVGGHGVTCSYPVGEMAAASIISGPPGEAGPFHPSRFRDQG
jgi:glycine/D-amino acid oxidase-like deaminating enzyme